MILCMLQPSSIPQRFGIARVSDASSPVTPLCREVAHMLFSPGPHSPALLQQLHQEWLPGLNAPMRITVTAFVACRAV
jgi:hypothetical protein